MPDPTPDSPETWLDQHGAALYKFALGLTRDADRAEEAVQETLVAALQAKERYAGGASVRTWLIGILKHKVIDMFRHEAREVTGALPEPFEEGEDALTEGVFDARGHWLEMPSNWGNPEELLARDQFMIILQRCLDGLPERLARLFWLREVLEEESESICKDLAISSTNLWTMLHRARLGLRRCLDRNWVGEAARG